MKQELTEKEIVDIKHGLYIAMNSSDHPSMSKLFDRLELIMGKLDDMRDNSTMREEPQVLTQSLTEKVLRLYVGRFLDPTLTAGEMITVFDLIEYNPDAKSQLQRLIEEKCTAELSPEQIEEALSLLIDPPAIGD